MAVPECAHRLMRCRPSLVRGRAAQVNPGGFTTPARRPSVRHCCKVSDEAAFCLIQRPYISKTLLTRRISPRGSP
ncbi:hypothetical protein DTL96_25785 [Escherichia coli]|nr:hypothetical protein DS983_25515 [Escherichia coli]RCZ38192.1 hypothetical protein DTL96_25785 [Escherichia coli]